MEGSEKGRRRGSARWRGWAVIGWDWCWIVMVTCLLEEVKQVLAGNVLEQEEQKGRCLKCAIEGDDVGMRTKRLMDSHLCERVNIGAYMEFPRD